MWPGGLGGAAVFVVELPFVTQEPLAHFWATRQTEFAFPLRKPCWLCELRQGRLLELHFAFLHARGTERIVPQSVGNSD